MGTQLAFPKHGAEAHFYCGQTAGWMKMRLGMEVGLGPADCVRRGPSYAPIKGHNTPNFRPIFVAVK